MDDPAMLTDAEVAHILRAHRDTPVCGDADAFAALAPMMETADEPGAPPPPRPEPGGLFIATTATSATGTKTRRWFWQPDAARWEQDARARGELR